MDYAKALVAVVVSAVGALIVALGPGNNTLDGLSTQSWLIAAATVLGSGALVYLVQNIHGVAGAVAKAALAFLTAGVASLVVALDDAVVTQSEWLIAFSAAVVATGLVYQAPGPEPVPPPGG